MRFILGFILGALLISGVSHAYRTGKPVQIRGVSPSDLVELNLTLEELWDITNGRYNLNITTTNPDGTEQGDVGDVILLNDSGTFYLEINTTGSTVWKGVALTDTP